jgi:hypothetical protein
VMIEIPEAQYLVNGSVQQNSSTLREIQSIVSAVWYGLALVGVRSDNYVDKVICPKRTIELHHEELRNL